MELSQLLDNVIEITKRPDARARSLLALNTIITEIVTNYDYPEDLVEETVPYPSTIGQVVIPHLTSKRIRSILWLQIRGSFIKQTTPREVMAGRDCQPMNVFYRSGQSIVINSKWENFQEFRIGYYPVPDTLREEAGSNQHWLLDSYPALLLNGTIARTFQATGDDDSAIYYERLYLELKASIRRSQLED